MHLDIRTYLPNNLVSYVNAPLNNFLHNLPEDLRNQLAERLPSPGDRK